MPWSKSWAGMCRWHSGCKKWKSAEADCRFPIFDERFKPWCRKTGSHDGSRIEKHLEAAEKSPKQIAAAVSGLPDKTLRYKPAPHKRCILAVLRHLPDSEVVYAYRIRQMRADKKPAIAPMHGQHRSRHLAYLETPP